MIEKQTFYEYISNGYSVFPIKFIWNDKDQKWNKKPMVKWGQYQNRLPSREEVEEWYNSFGQIEGIGMATGAASGIDVIDLDDESLLEKYDLTSPMVVKSAFHSNGRHYYYQHTQEIRNTAFIKGEGLDFRGDGGYVVLPPSEKDGKKYEWEKNMGRGFLEPLPEWFLQKLSEHKKEISKVVQTGDVWTDGLNAITDNFLAPVEYGGRNDAEAVNVGKLLRKLPRELWELSGWPTIVAWNSKLPQPLPLDELRNTYNSIFSKAVEEITQENVSENNFAKLIEDNLWTEERIMSVEIPNDRFLVEELIPKGCVFLSGPPKAMKSYISLHLIDCLANKKPLFKHFEVPKKRKILVMDRENQMWSVKDRINQTETRLGEDVSYLNVRTSFTNAEFRAVLLEFIKMNRIEVVILDSFRRFFTGNENDSAIVSEFFLFIDQIKDAGCSVIIIHHFNKNQEARGSSRLRGSSDIVAFYDANINFSKKADGGVTILELEQTESRLGKEVSPFTVNIIESEDGKMSFGFGEYIEKEQTARDDASKKILDLLSNLNDKEEWLSSLDIKDRLGDVSKRYIDEVLPKLSDNHKIRREKLGRGYVYKIGTEVFNDK